MATRFINEGTEQMFNRTTKRENMQYVSNVVIVSLFSGVLKEMTMVLIIHGVIMLCQCDVFCSEEVFYLMKGTDYVRMLKLF